MSGDWLDDWAAFGGNREPGVLIESSTMKRFQEPIVLEGVKLFKREFTFEIIAPDPFYQKPPDAITSGWRARLKWVWSCIKYSGDDVLGRVGMEMTPREIPFTWRKDCDPADFDTSITFIDWRREFLPSHVDATSVIKSPIV